MALNFGVCCRVTGSWTPLRDDWPIIVVIFALAVIRQDADLYEHYRYEHDYELDQDHRAGRRHAPHV